MMKLQDLVIETARLRLLPTSESYAEEIFREFTPEITIFMHPKSPDKIEDTLEFIRTAREKMLNNQDLVVVILDKFSKEFLGHGGLHGIHKDTPEIGIWIKKSAHGKKYGREAVVALKGWADKNLIYKYLRYPVDKRNVPSRKIAESLGGEIKKEYKKMNMAGKKVEEEEDHIFSPKK